MKTLFNLDKTARESGLSQAEIERIKEDVRKEFPDDEMMWELHVLRVFRSRQRKTLRRPEKKVS
jgi:hypothetical protein